MDSRILEIVFYLMDHIQNGDDQLSGLQEYSADLKDLGYSDNEISSAYRFILDQLGTPAEPLYSDIPERQFASRVLTSLERSRLSPEAHGLLLRLCNSGFLSGRQFENILDRLMLAGPRLVSADQVKLLVSAVLISDSDRSKTDLLSRIDTEQSSHIN